MVTFPKGPCTQIVYTLALSSPHIGTLGQCIYSLGTMDPYTLNPTEPYSTL